MSRSSLPNGKLEVIIRDDDRNLLGSLPIEREVASWLMDIDNQPDWAGPPIEVNIRAGDVGGASIYQVCVDGNILFEGGIGPLSAGTKLNGLEHVFRFDRSGWNAAEDDGSAGVG